MPARPTRRRDSSASGAPCNNLPVLEVDWARLTAPEVLLCTPSYAAHLVERAPDQMRALGLRSIVCAGEPGAGLPEVRAAIEYGSESAASRRRAACA